MKHVHNTHCGYFPSVTQDRVLEADPECASLRACRSQFDHPRTAIVRRKHEQGNQYQLSGVGPQQQTKRKWKHTNCTCNCKSHARVSKWLCTSDIGGNPRSGRWFRPSQRHSRPRRRLSHDTYICSAAFPTCRITSYRTW